MIISRTPFRISFFGGGTDYPDWYRKNGGAVLSSTINKYCYITCRYLPPFFDYKYRVRYTRREETQTIQEIKHPSVRECLKFVNLSKGIEVQHNGDLPAMSGLGSSSAFTVGLLNALYALKGKITTKRSLALDAIHVEQDKIKENVGSQDQTTTAFGGLNMIEFGGPQEVLVTPITINADKLNYLKNHLMLFFIGFPRMASKIAREQIKNIPGKKNELMEMMMMVKEAVNILNNGKKTIEDFGKLLNESWKLKRGLASSITNSHIDSIYDAAMKSGALGGKILGAGGGGFMMFFAKPGSQRKVKEKLKKLLYVPFNFENLGSQIIYYAPGQDI